MKQIYFLLLATWFLTVLTACGGTPPVATQEETEYTAVRDDTSALQISIPVTWGETDGRTAEMASKRFATIAASTKLADFSNFTAPGMYLLVNSGAAGEDQTVEAWKKLYTTEPQNCSYLSSVKYGDSQFTGEIGFFQNCKSAQNEFAILVAAPIKSPAAYTLTLMLNSISGESTDAATANIQKLLGTFFVTGDLP